MSKKTRIKIRERKDSRFSVGLVEVILFSIGAVPAYLGRNGAWLDWLEKGMSQIGLGGFGRLGSVSLTLAVSLAFCIPATILATRSKLRLQPLRDAETNSSGTNALYLRSFFTDTKALLPNPFYSNLSSGISLESQFIGPEEFVGRVLEPYIDVREVGGDATTVGNGRIPLLEETWQMTVVKAIRAASVIIILPSLSRDKNNGQIFGTGMIWELKYLVKSGQVSRMIAIMPKVDWLRRKSTRESWEQAREAASKFGLILPEYCNTGGIIIFEHSQGVWRPKKIFGQSKFRRKRFAIGLVEALKWQAEHNGFELLVR